MWKISGDSDMDSEVSDLISDMSRELFDDESGQEQECLVTRGESDGAVLITSASRGL